MEHEVFVPLPAADLRQVLADPGRAARALPGLQQEAGAEPIAGRLKLRIGGTSVTYRGRLRLVPSGDDFTTEGEATEVRGHGSVKFTLTLRLTPTDDGTRLTFSGTGTADGRTAQLPPTTVESALRRLLGRVGENLVGERRGAGDSEAGDATAAESGAAGVPEAEGGPTGETAAESGTSSLPGAEVSPEAEVPPATPGPRTGEDERTDETPTQDARDLTPEEGSTSEEGPAPEAEEPARDAAALTPEDEDLVREVDDLTPVPEDDESMPAMDTPAGEAEPPAEAAHARRTMIGRSAEEVDHAPPRGRYAPVPPPDAFSAGATLRWAAPAAALVVASAIVVGRALRRRR